ncbi:TlpA family protein disulfide reductase [Metabacillus iocasae]|uniref:Peroxiredoxin n=1 Tax=Priestia iocasae TaxID=2291674 RepID=A0ABS2QWB8_9BACI|nr:TlpA disulfide reductase family protein [Metabacillus iocasae]MBM7703781.1 peroxiredoxin [Metabacillus iocasae]
MVKKILAVLLLLGLGGYALWQGVLPKNAEDNLSEYEDANIKEEESQEVAEYGLETGKKAPVFKLRVLGGEEVSLSDYQGKKVILNFWATWCPPCKAEMPEMQKFYNQYSDDVEILAVNLTSSEQTVDAVNQFLQERGFTFPVLLDEKEEVSSKQYKILTIPTTYFIDESGTITKRINGPMNYEQMEAFAKE